MTPRPPSGLLLCVVRDADARQRLLTLEAIAPLVQARGGSMRSNPIELSDAELEAILINTLAA